MNKGQKLIRRMTIIGIMIGVTTVILILNIGATVSKRMSGSLLVHPNLVTVRPDYMAGVGAFGMVGGGPMMDAEFSFKNLQHIKNLDYVADVYPEVLQQYILGEEQYHAEVNVAFLHEDFDIKKFYDIEITETADVDFFSVFVEEKLFNELNQPTTIEMSKRRLHVAGTFKSNHVFLKKGLLVQADMYEALFGDQFNSLNVMLKEAIQMPTIGQFYGDVAAQFAGNYVITPSEDGKKEIESFLTTTINLFLFFGFLTVLVSGIGIMNLTYIMISNERSQICIKRAVGATALDITKEYLFKIFRLTFQGTILGIIIGLSGTYLVASLTQMEIALSPVSIILSFGFAFGLSFIFGFYPVHLASTENIVDAL